MPWADGDLEDFLDDDMPGVVGAVINGSLTVVAHFRQPTAEVFDAVGGFKPVLRCKAQDVQGVAVGATVVIGAGNFTVESISPARNTGWVLLELEA